MLTVDESLRFARQTYTPQSFAGVLCAEVERLRAELAAREWRTIESAPRDGTEMFLMRRDAVGIASIGAGSWGCRVDGNSEGWISYNRHQWFPQTPTHWMPLPPELKP